MREPLFILSPPRSYSSLISSMLGQHPDMHAFPELQLFGHERIIDMITKNQDSLNRLATPGSVRAIAEIHEGKQSDESCTRAWLWMLKHADWTPVEFFDYLREKIDPHIAIEKTPPNTLKMSRLKQIVSAYPNAKYLHLTRSVVGNHRSLVEYLDGMDRLLGKQVTVDAISMDVLKEYPACIWLVAHRNILSISPLVKAENYLRIKGEDMLEEPEEMLRNICRWMDIDDRELCIEAMMRPHESPYAYVGPRIAYGGNDGKFMKQPVLRLKKDSGKLAQSFRQEPTKSQLAMDRTTLFENSAGNKENELQPIRAWLDDIFNEIGIMQTRLGY